MGLLKRLGLSRPAASPAPVRRPLYMKYSTASSEKYSITPDEERFFWAFEDALMENDLDTYISLTRMANGAISVSTSSAYIGKIKLQGRKTWMQYMTGLYNAEVEENLLLEGYIQLLKYWVRTVKKGGRC
ncbi:hypothetical protein [Faecalibacterium sp. An192]|uniref:hypothetical protein n=1 Tax=Faecalibacterium sp. An192 TaxID=1965581 RepID=UPI000B365CC6|nr:hypothetical protein [Faecalibacterium sp. An192]OUP26506.1 hypothetical protein B5F27_13260 [Faecalibacterium sp. An192]